MTAVIAKPSFVHNLDRGNSLSSGIVLACPFFERSSTKIHDVSGRNHHGTIKNGTPEMDSSLYGMSLFNNALTENITFGAINDLSFGNGTVDNKFSVFINFYLNTLTTTTVLFSKDGATREHLVFILSSGDLSTGLFKTGSNTVFIGRRTGAGGVSAGQWYSLLYTYDATAVNSGFKLYLNGSRKDVSNSSGGSGYTATNDKSVEFTIGARSSDDLGFNGFVSNFVVWKDRELTAIDASNLHHDPFLMYRRTSYDWLKNTPISSSYINILRKNRLNSAILAR